MALDPNGVYQYTLNDVVQDWASFMNLGTSSVSNVLREMKGNMVVTAASLQDMTKKKDALVTAGVSFSPANLGLFWRTDEKKMYAWNGTRFDVILGGSFTDSYVEYASTGTWSRFSTELQQTIGPFNLSLPAAGVWLVSGSVTLKPEEDGSNTADFTLSMSFDNGGRRTAAYFNSYGYKYPVSVTLNPRAITLDAPKTLAVKLTLDISKKTNHGWGGPVITATRVG